LPSWAEDGAVFALNGKVWRVVALASTNRGTWENKHFYECVHAEEVTTEDPWALPEAPCPKDVVGVALRRLRDLPMFRADELVSAMHIVRGGP